MRATFNGLNGFAQAADDMAKSGDTPGNGFRWQQVVATFISATAFTSFAPGDFEMLRQLFSETAAKPFFHVGADGIQAANLLLHQFTSAEILVQYFGIFPKVLEELAGELVDAE